ncbi:MAG: hypothetical protein NZ889_03105, partial [Candidatus Pacearchaeota archaeon]|nr:hypothetical protein [Candidatus Pacearchaeota archaeon]
LKHKEKLEETKFVTSDTETLVQLEKRGLGKIILFSCIDEETPKFSPSISRFPGALKKMLQEKIAAEEATERIIDVTSILQIWLVADEIAHTLTSTTSTTS